MIEKVFPGEISHGPLLPDGVPGCQLSRLQLQRWQTWGAPVSNGDGAKTPETSVGDICMKFGCFARQTNAP